MFGVKEQFQGDHLFWLYVGSQNEKHVHMYWTVYSWNLVNWGPPILFLTILGNFTRWILGKNFAIVSFYARAVYVQKPHWFCNTSLYSYAAQWSNIRKNVQNMYNCPLISSCFERLLIILYFFLQVRQLFQYSIQNYSTSKIEKKLRIKRGRIESFCVTGVNL